MIQDPSTWAVIVNPHSGKKISNRHWEVIHTLLKEQHLEFDYVFTQAPNHAIELAADFVKKGYQNILVVGGDGTLNETLNGILKVGIEKAKSITLAIIPCGTGNDWGRFWGLNRNHKKAISILHTGKPIKIDIGLCSYQDHSGAEQKRYFINAAGIGFDTHVLSITNLLKRFFGGYKWVYTVSVFISAIIYRSRKMKVTIKDETIEKNIYTASIGNGCYTGGGIKQTPNALPYDGFFDISLVERPSFLKLVSGLHLLFTGRLLEHPCVNSIKNEQIIFSNCPKSKMEVDGIILNGTAPFELSLLPQCINFLVPKNKILQ